MRVALDLARTRAALASYDEASAAVDAARTADDAEHAFDLYDAGLALVGAAFALDTADRNRAEDCVIHAHNSHLLQSIRRLVAS